MTFSLKQIFSLLFFLSLIEGNWAQSIHKIDSINNIPFNVKVDQSTSLVKVYLKTIQEAKKINYKKGEAFAESNLSIVYYYQGKYDKNVVHSLKAIQLFEQINDKESLAYEYALLGYCMKRRNMQQAQIYMLKGKAIAEKGEYKQKLTGIYDNYGVLKEMQNQLDSARYFYKKGLELKIQLNDSIGLPYSLNNLAGVDVIEKNYAAAKINYDKAFQIRLSLKDHVGMAENYSYYGDLFVLQNKLNEAIQSYQKSIDLCEKHHYPDLKKDCFQKLASCYEKLSDSKKALDYFKRYNSLNDSLLQESTRHKIAELEVVFDTNEKEKSLLEKEIQVKQSQTRLLIVSASLLFVLLIAGFIYRQQKLKNKQQKQEFELQKTKLELDKQLELESQRLQISRDLHDNVGAQLTFIISSVENLSYGGKITDENSLGRIAKISQFTKSTIVDLRDTIWAMNSGIFTFQDFQSRLNNFINKAQFAKEDIQFTFKLSDNCQDIQFSSSAGIHLYRVIQEAVNNAIKYAHPTLITVEIEKEIEFLKVKISDNGTGFDPNEVLSGNGLYNMQKRMDELNGSFKLTSTIQTGTIIELQIQLSELNK